jgi:hypothetical protein
MGLFEFLKELLLLSYRGLELSNTFSKKSFWTVSLPIRRSSLAMCFALSSSAAGVSKIFGAPARSRSFHSPRRVGWQPIPRATSTAEASPLRSFRAAWNLASPE